MVDVAPFRALRYWPQKEKNKDISKFICPPYDVISPHERESLVKKSPENVVQLELPSGPPLEKFKMAADVLKSWRAHSILQEDRSPAYYLLETTFRIKDPFAPSKSLKRYGVLLALRLETPGKGAVHPHEKTLPKAKEERLNLQTALQTNVSPIFGLFFDKKKEWRKWIAQVIKTKPLVEGKEHRDLEHRMWKVDAAPLQKSLRALLKEKDLYIADGHHRYEVAWAYQEARLQTDAATNSNSNCGWERVMTYVCPMEEPGLLMLPTHRLVKSSRTLAEWTQHLKSIFDITPVKKTSDIVKALSQSPDHRIGWIHGEGAALLKLKSSIGLDRCLAHRPAALRELDVILLHDLALGEASNEGFLKDREIVFTRDIAGMEMLAKKDPAWVGFVLGSPGVESLARVAAANEVMPPKTTYFYPKVPTGFTLMPLEQKINP